MLEVQFLLSQVTFSTHAHEEQLPNSNNVLRFLGTVLFVVYLMRLVVFRL
jgi:hypothetical protein